MDPLTALIVAVWAAYYLVRDGIDGVTSARGNIPHGAVNRHAERMQRMQHAHEKWMARHADQRKLRERGHSTIGRALQDRVAKWVENAGRRVDKADEAVRAAEENDVRIGRTAGSWRTSWRRARQAMARKWQNLVERAEERLSDRYDREHPFVPTEPAAKAVTEDDSKPATEAPTTRTEARRPESGPLPPPPGQRGNAKRATAGGSADDVVDAEIVDEPARPATSPEADVIDAEVVEPEVPKTPASRELEAAAPPSNVIPINRGEHMSDPTQTLVLSSGETINPEAGITLADGLIAIYAEMGSRIQASHANLSQAGVAQDQIGKLAELLGLNSACQGKAEEMKEHFVDHQNAAALVGATGAGTRADYLGQH